MNELRKEIEETLNEQRRTLRDMDEKGWISSDRNITEGWVEALEYVLGQIDAISSTGEPTVTVDDYHKRGDLYVTVRFPDGDEYSGLVEKQEGEEE